jgi:hypothetical protein
MILDGLEGKLGKCLAKFCSTPKALTHLSRIHMDQMILSEPSIIIIWTYQDMMEWMSRKLVGEMAGADEDFGLKIAQIFGCLFMFKPQLPI